MKAFAIVALLALPGAASAQARLPCPGWLSDAPGGKDAYDALPTRSVEAFLAFAKEGKADAVGGEAFYRLVAERGVAAWNYVSANHAALARDPEMVKALCAEPWRYFETPKSAPKSDPAPPYLLFGAGALVGLIAGRLSKRGAR